jgi:putative membrane protein
MKNEERRFLLLALLFLFLVARILQLFAGRVPNLLIVTLHVIPPALFALVHGARIYRSRGILIFATLCLGVGTLFEGVSLRTGFPFGHYRFTDLMGPKLFDLPILLALAYVGMGYLSWVLAVVILDCQNEPLSGRNIVLLPLAASFVMTAWDFSMDAVWADIDHAWVWRDGGPYYGVPTSNFFGWFLTVYIFYQLFALYLRNRVIMRSPTTHWRLAILFYAASAAGNLLVVAPLSMGGHFVDAAGKHWAIPDILWASRLVSIFLMMPLSLMAWVKASGPVEPLSKQVSLGIPSESRASLP